MNSMIDFVYIENAKTKIATIAKEMLGIVDDLPEEVMGDVVEQTIHFMNDMERMVNEEPKNHLYILADLFVANMITSALLFSRFKEMAESYEDMAIKYQILKEKVGEDV